MSANPSPPQSEPLTERELQVTIQAVKDAMQMDAIMRQGDPTEMERIIQKLTAKTEAGVEAYGRWLNQKMSRSRGND